ncbi:hypothetical protein DL765_000316 [Monosporascus sp. GIB2]|nr:hypothetical protein DL765_000316 [Monosporascus sp. GIB2]
MATENQTPISQKLPAGLATVLNAPEDRRDSAYYSSTDASSKHTSAASGIGINVYASAHDKTPSPTTTTNLVPQPIVSPVSNMSVASMVSPASPGGGRFDRPISLDSISGAASIGRESRRESVDSRMNQNFGELRLTSSPYASQNQSTTSIQGSLAQQRNPRAGIEQLAAHRISNGYQPNVERTPEGHGKVVRTAPAITGPATSNIARAAEPTKGQAWAFPEEEIQRVPSATTNRSFYDSRRSSITESIASSQFTTESRLPPGQRRLDESLATDYQRLSNVSGEYPSHVHHHTLQHKQDLHSEESSPPGGAQPYSRTPELRLRDLMPQERGSKASKWEILTKAIAEHQRQQDAIKQLSSACQNSQQEAHILRRELERARAENEQLRNNMAMPPAQSSANHAVPSQVGADRYAQDPYGRPPPQRPELPPLRSLSGNLPNAPDSMTGVQYEERPNGFRQDRF